MRNAIAVAVALLLLTATPASAINLVTPNGRVAEPWQTWADSSHAPTVRITVTVKEDLDGCPPEGAACVNFASPITLHTGNITRPAELYHELGHIFDYELVPEWAHARFLRIMYLPAGEWWGSGPGMSRAEWFAEAYSRCAAPKQQRGGSAGIYDPTPRQNRRVCRMIWNVVGGAPRMTPAAY